MDHTLQYHHNQTKKNVSTKKKKKWISGFMKTLQGLQRLTVLLTGYTNQVLIHQYIT